MSHRAPVRRLHFHGVTGDKSTGVVRALGSTWATAIVSLAFRLRAGLASLSSPLVLFRFLFLLTLICLLNFPYFFRRGEHGNRGVTTSNIHSRSYCFESACDAKAGARERSLQIEKRVESSMHSRSKRRPLWAPLRGRAFSIPLLPHPTNVRMSLVRQANRLRLIFSL